MAHTAGVPRQKINHYISELKGVSDAGMDAGIRLQAAARAVEAAEAKEAKEIEAHRRNVDGFVTIVKAAAPYLVAALVMVLTCIAYFARARRLQAEADAQKAEAHAQKAKLLREAALAAPPAALVAGRYSSLPVTAQELSQLEASRKLDTLFSEILSSNDLARLQAARDDASLTEDKRARVDHVLQQRQRSCVICTSDEDVSEGVECEGNHFVCDNCFSHFLIDEASVKPQKLQGLYQIACPAVHPAMGGCECSLPHGSLQHATQAGLIAYHKRVSDREERILRAVFEEQRQRFEAEFAAKSEQERSVLVVRKVVEEMMDVACPKCLLRFDEFSECAALNCSRVGADGRPCGANFCALCFTDCGSLFAAHEHVRSHCEFRNRPGLLRETYYLVEPAMVTWTRFLNTQRAVKLRAYLPTLPEAVRNGLREDPFVVGACREHGLEGLLGIAGDQPANAGIVELQAMGFDGHSVQDLERILLQAENDVATAAAILRAEAELAEAFL